MRLSELMKNTDVILTQDVTIRGITCRYQDVKPHYLYLCRVGTHTDGHTFAVRAASAGAAVIVAERDVGLPNTVFTRDTNALWPHLCATWFGHPTDRLSVIGVTGTNGKTSTCHMLWSQLAACGVRAGLVGTVENRIGHLACAADHTTPDAYDLQRLFALMAADGCTHAVMEVSSHALAQARTAGIRFAAGIFTNLTRDHLDYHVTMDAYAAAKRRLFHQTDLAVVNADDPFAATMTDGFAGRSVRYGCDPSADWAATDLRPTPTGTAFTLRAGNGAWPVSLRATGTFAVYNALAATATLASLGFSPTDLVRALDTMPAIRGRAETVGFYRGARVVIDYAHTPDGLTKIGQALRPYTAGQLVMLFGCGGDRDKQKRPLMAQAAAAVADRLIITSDNPRSESPDRIIDDIVAGLTETATPYTVIADRVRAIEYLLQRATAGDTLVLAGKGHETTQTLADRTVRLDEREIVRRIIESEEHKDGYQQIDHHDDRGICGVFDRGPVG